MNDRIRAREVRLVGPEGDQLGIKSLDEARQIAHSHGLDLVEVAAQASPPVCRIMDWGKHRYEQSQKAKEARRKQSQVLVKEMKFRPKIDHHDYETKKRHVVRFLEDGAKVKITIMFRGREMTHTELGKKILDQLAEELEELAAVEAPAKLDGRNMIMVLAPLHKKERPDTGPTAPKGKRKGKGKNRQRKEKTAPPAEVQAPEAEVTGAAEEVEAPADAASAEAAAADAQS